MAECMTEHFFTGNLYQQDSGLNRVFLCISVYLQVEGPKQDLHSGVYGGVVIEPMTDLIGILG